MDSGAFSMTRRRIASLLAVAAALGLIVAGCGGGGSTKVSAGSVAKVQKVDITRSSFTALMDQAQRSYTSQKRTFPTAGSSEYVALQQQAVQFLVQRAEFEVKAADLGVKIDEKTIDTRLADVKKQYFGGDEKKFQTQIKAQGLTAEQVRADIRAQILSEEVFKKVTADVKVSDVDVKAYYDKKPTTYTQAESRDVRHILVKTKALADEVYAQVKYRSATDSWNAPAKKYSEDPSSKDTGGKLTISRGQTVPEFDASSFALKTGEVSQPIKTQFGYHVIQALSDVKPKKTQPLTEVRETIRQQLLQQKRSEGMTAWVEGVKQEFASKVAYATGFEPPAAATSIAATTTG